MTVSNYHFLGMDIKVNWEGTNPHPTEDAALQSAQLPQVAGTAQHVQVTEPENVSTLSAPAKEISVPVQPDTRTGSYDTSVGDKKKAEGSQESALPALSPVLEKSGATKDDTHEDGSKKDEKAPVQPTAEAFAQASPAVKSQLQQPEVVKASLVSGAPEAEELSKSEKTPATAVLRDVPAVQQVLRAKIEEDVPANAVDFSLQALVSFLQPQVEQKKLDDINEHIERLIGVLIPSFLKETQERFFRQLDALIHEVQGIVEKGEKDWAVACRTAGDQLCSGLEQVTDQALKEVDSVLESGKREASSIPTRWHRGNRRHK